MRKLLVLYVVLATASTAWSQSESVGPIIGDLQKTFSKVETASFTYEQEIKLVEYATVNYAFKQTDKKGSETSFQKEFNLADIDPYTVRQETQKDLLFVVLTAKNKQKLFKTIKNGKTEPYDEEVRIHAKDVDHARVMIDLVKKAIPIGEKIMNAKLKLEGYENMVKWLEGHVTKASEGNKSIEQTMQRQSLPGSFKLLQIESDGKSSKQAEYFFNVSDINVNTMGFRISGNSFGVQFEMLNKLKSATVVRDGTKKTFVDDMVIFTNGVDEARDIRNVITMMSPLALAKVKADMPNPKNTGEALDQFSTFVKSVTIGTTTYAQTTTPKCQTTLTQTQQSASSTEVNTYTFNWMDVNPNMAKLEVSGEKMMMRLPMIDKKKLVSHSKDQKVVGFEDDAIFYIDNMEEGRRINVLVGKAIEYCKSGYKVPFPASTEGVVGWLKSNVGEVAVEETVVKQSIEAAEAGNTNKMKFTSVTIKASSSVEEVFEFNLSDINPNSVDYQASGKWLRVKFETNFRNKIIKAYKAGKIQPYVYSLEIAVKDAEAARGLILALKKCAEDLKGK